MKIKCVTGSPGSGKSTYVRDNCGENDIVYDYDLLLQAVTLKKAHTEPTEGQHHVLSKLRFDVIRASQNADVETLWMISSKPSEQLMEALGVDAEYINLDISEEEALERVNSDESREDKDQEAEKVHEYFKEEKSMIRDNREYRSMPLLTRAEGETFTTEGYASTFDEYMLFEDGDNKFFERIERTAFDNTDMSDVVFLIDHEGRVYARTRNGSIEVGPDENGLHCRVDLSRSSAARELQEDIECGNYDRMSFAFTVADDEIVRDDQGYHRVIKSVGKLFDISAVSFPANPYTSIGKSARSAFDGFIEEEKRLELVKAEEARKLEQLKKEFEEIQ